MSQENAADPTVAVPGGQEQPVGVPPAEVAVRAQAPEGPQKVSSPPRPRVVAQPAADAREELSRLAGEVARHGTRKMLWDYLKLRTRVLGRPRVSQQPQRSQG